jgi:hypothetical protein
MMACPLLSVTREAVRLSSIATDRMPIRPAKESDAGAVATLLENLGYPATTDQVSGRLRAILLRDDYSILVADDGNALLDREVVWRTGQRAPRLFARHAHRCE